MKSVIRYTLLIVVLPLFLLCGENLFAQKNSNTPKSRDLKESGDYQRRDLSLPFSRVVINFFDFSSKLSAAEYSNRATMPLNVAYLSTEKNEKGKAPSTRFSRSVSDLLTVHNYNNTQEVLEDSSRGQAVKYETEWMPHVLPFFAEYADSAKLKGIDFLYDEHTIVRKIEFSSKIGANFSFSGNYNGEIEFKDNKIFVDNNNIRYCIMFSLPVTNFVKNRNRWGLNIRDQITNDSIVISVSFADNRETVERLVSRTELPIKNKDTNAKLKLREKYWDDLLVKIPHPHNFELSEIRRDGVTPEQLRQVYYKAWVFTIQNVLPKDDEVYPYPQICTGKSSLWDEGEVRAPFSAAWESFLGIQFYAYIDPQTAWDAFKGLMSLVDSTGMLGGESLPSRKAQTALLLYRLSGDTSALKEVYPALTRYFNWRLRIVHWVYGDLRPDENLKDAEFTFSALADINDMMTISAILGKYDELEEWKFKHKKFYNDCLKWFWPNAGVRPSQTINLETGKRTSGHALWITTGLNLQPLLKGDYLKSMMDLFDLYFDPAKPFAGFSMPKYPDLSFTVYGLIKHGYTKKAVQLMEATLRDIVKANGSFAEQYSPDDLKPDGVRPSLFGALSVIDFTLLINGRSYLQPDSINAKRRPDSNGFFE